MCAVSVEEIWRGLRADEEHHARRLLGALRLAPLGVSEGRRAGLWRREAASRGITASHCIIGTLDADVATARCAAGLRADYRSVKLPDAFVIATEIVHRADALLTTDRGWPSTLTGSLEFEIHVV